MAVSIYCHMEKIIYCDTKLSVDGKGKNKDKRCLWEWIAKVMRLSYPVTEKQVAFLGCPVHSYVIEGISRQEAAGFWRQRTEEKLRDGNGSVTRFIKTIREIEKRMKKEEMQEKEREIQSAFLFLTWAKSDYPLELVRLFYEECRKENGKVGMAEQLIFLDGCEEGAFEAEESEREVTLLSEICGAYNHVTIITENPDRWEGVTENAYEEYGLSIRCVSDDRNVCFREKKTLILDMGSENKKCCKNFPKDSMYMDFCESEEKRRIISVKCREIPYLSIRNALDTVLKDAV